MLLSKKQKEELKEAVATICLLHIDDEGFPRYTYLAVRGDTLPELEKAIKRKKVEFDKLGVILASGFGLPSDEVKAEMESKYGFKTGDIVNLD